MKLARFGLGLLVAATLAGCSGPRTLPTPAPAPDIVATFGNETLTLADFEREYAKTSASAAGDSAEAYADFLQRYVNFRLKVMAAKERGLENDPDIQKELAEYRGQLARPYLLEKEILDTLIRQVYERQQEEIHASHLLIEIGEFAPPADTLIAYRKIAAIRDSLLAGADFGEMAVRHSDDPSVQRNRGDLGYFTGGRMIEPFESVAYATPVGDISPIVRTSFGYHLLTVHNRVPRLGDVRAAHIMLRVPGPTPEDSAQARQQIADLKQRIEAGEDFATLAREYSQDPGSAQQGGDLGYFNRQQMVQPFADVAFALNNTGDVSDVVETRFGFHLIKLLGRRELPTYDEAYPEIKQLVMRLPRLKTAELALGRQVRTERGFSVDSTALTRSVTTKVFSSGQLRKEQVIATLGDSTYTLGQFADFLQARQIQAERAAEAQLTRSFTDFLDQKGFDYAVASLEERDPDFARLMQEFRDGVLLFRVSEDSVWTAAAQDSVGLRQYFEANRSEYQHPDRQRIVSFFSRNDSLLNVIAQGLDAGQRDFADLFAAHAEAVRVDTTRISGTTNSLYDRILGQPTGTRSDLLQYQNGRLLLFVDGDEPARQKTFEEARAEVVTDYQQVLEKEWLDRLHVRYNVRLYPERLDAAFSGASGSMTNRP